MKLVTWCLVLDFWEAFFGLCFFLLFEKWLQRGYLVLDFVKLGIQFNILGDHE